MSYQSPQKALTRYPLPSHVENIEEKIDRVHFGARFPSRSIPLKPKEMDAIKNYLSSIARNRPVYNIFVILETDHNVYNFLSDLIEKGVPAFQVCELRRLYIKECSNSLKRMRA